ncbi:hypothetical protein TrLO_g4755 [Triparma laevis f. longispina]|uniref:DAGKc domain-containing protein n=1 Tax=Triparma laevis f. longispina TaxID=1714387 RepID=A0A9W6ZT47_9STRA|nr:hypothetical protein TrLO_g4755 [Triparma laevis f. longispina]
MKKAGASVSPAPGSSSSDISPLFKDESFKVNDKSREELLTEDNIMLLSDEGIRLPKMLDGLSQFTSYLFLWLLFSLVTPIIFLITSGNMFGLPWWTLFPVGYVLLHGTSFGTFIWRGVIFIPPPYKLTRIFRADNVGIENNKVEHIVVITNGKAGPDGGKRKDVKFEKCKDIWLAKNIQITQIPTTHRNHAYELVRDMDMTGVDVVVCVGGDGTIHEVINGWCAREDKHEGTRFGFIPGGSGNNVSRTLGTINVEKAARWCTGGSAKDGGGDCMNFDCIKVVSKTSTICSINTLCFGLIGDIGVIAEELRICGPSRYENTAFVKLLAGYKQHIVITFEFEDGRIEVIDQFYLSCFLNATQYFGKGHRVCPEAMLDNGTADFIGLKSGIATRGELLAALTQAKSGAHLSNPKTQHIRGIRAAHFRFDSPGIFNIDGEAMRHDGEVFLKVFKGHCKVMADRETMCGGDVKSVK